MAPSALAIGAILLAASPYSAYAACSIPEPSSNIPSPNVANGYIARRVATGLQSPRGLKFDSAGHLLVIQQYHGLQSLTLKDGGGDCVGVASQKTVVSDNGLNHGLELSADGQTLYASTVENVYSYPYTASSSTADTSSRRTLINNMTNPDHVTRTLLLSKKVPGTLVVSRGSGANIDPVSADITSGRASVRAFNLKTLASGQTYDFPSDGKRLGWGLRNDVGIDEHPVTGGIFGVENSGDNLVRFGVDIHNSNPAEELNYLGHLDPSIPSPTQGKNFGYPACFTAWNVAIIPNNSAITRGSQFSVDPTASLANDQSCRTTRVAPRLSFKAHMAPLDILFNTAGSVAWVTFHGSYDRAVPVGYKLGQIKWDSKTGMPVDKPSSGNAVVNILQNQNPRDCGQSGPGCFRPVGLAFDKKGRLYMSSDATGEIYIVTKKDGSGVNS